MLSSDEKYVGWAHETAELSQPAPCGALFDTRGHSALPLGQLQNVEALIESLGPDRRRSLYRAEEEAKTLCETSFFRDWQIFHLLRVQVIPQLIAQRRLSRRLNVWSAGCSTGQEAYSVAMLLREHFPELDGWEVRVIGTDLSQEAISAARSGRYRMKDAQSGLPAAFQVKYLQRVGEMCAVVSRVKTLCEFIHADLREELPGEVEFDLVLLRNVLLYLAPEERERVLAGVRRRMVPGGALVLGNGEQAEDSTDLFVGELAPGGYVYRPARHSAVSAMDGRSQPY